MVKSQGGDISYLTDLESFGESRFIEPVYSEEAGFVYKIDAKKIGKLACNLGAGRIKKEDKIDPTVGISLEKKVGEYVAQDEILAYIHTNNSKDLENAKKELKEIIKIRKEKVKPKDTIIKVIE